MRGLSKPKILDICDPPAGRIKEEEDMKYKIVFSNGTAKIVDHPNFIKMNPRYPSFICCGRDDAECVMLQEGEESVCYNIAVQRYPEYDVVDVRTV